MHTFTWTSLPQPCACGRALAAPLQLPVRHRLPQDTRQARPGSAHRQQHRPSQPGQRCQAASEVAEAPRPAAPQPPRPPKAQAPEFDYEVMEKLRAEGGTHKGTILDANRGGFIVQLEAGPKGFTPYRMVDPARLRDKNDQLRNIDSIDEGGEEEAAGAPPQGGKPKRRKLVGQPISVKVVQVDKVQASAVLSETAAKKEEFMASVQPGDVVNGNVDKLTDFGAFVALKSLDGQNHGVEGLVHITELSWQKVTMPEAVVKEGEGVRCQILSMDPSRGRINLSMKRLQDDPLQASLETVMPLDQLNEEDKVLHVPSFVPANVDKVAGIISRQPGIDALRMGRQVEEKGAVSQDLELYISKDHHEDGITLIARSEGRVQEILLTTSMDTAALKKLVQNVLKRLV